MSTTRKLFFIAVIILFAQSCKKGEPVSTNSPGVFYYDGNVDGSAVYYEAGQDDYYMFTSYMQDANNVYNFRGELAPYSCSTCGPRLKITINDFEQSTVNGYAQIGTSLAPGFFSYANPYGAPTEFNVQFNSGSVNGTPNSIDWDFGDGTTQINYADPVHTYMRPGKYLVTMHSNFSSDTIVSSYRVNVGIPDKLCGCSFGASGVNGNTVSFYTSLSSQYPSYTYSWDFGDGNTSVSNNPSHQYANSGVYAVKLWVQDGAGHQAEFERHVATQYCTDSYTDFYVSSVTTNQNLQYLSNVIIEWTDENGVSYTSNNTHQSAESFFKVVENAPYDQNSNSQSTRKLKLQFKCELYSASDSMPADGYAIFGVAYH